MPRTLGLAAILAALVLAAPAAADPPRQRIADDAAIRALMVDHTFYGRYTGGMSWTEYYAPDGRAAYREQCIHAGRWWVQHGAACFHYPTMLGPNTFCFDVYRMPGGQLDFRLAGSDPERSGSAYTVMIAPGNPEKLPLEETGCQISRAGGTLLALTPR